MYYVILDILNLLMKFFLSLFTALQSQIGSSQIERTTQTFMTLLTKYLFTVCVNSILHYTFC